MPPPISPLEALEAFARSRPPPSKFAPPSPPPPPARPATSNPVWRQEPVEDCADLRRILALPRRPYEPLPSEEEAARLSARLRRPGGARSLYPIQAFALQEAERAGGLLAPLGAGEGKTDICVNLPEILNSRVALLLVPAALKAKFWRLEYPLLARNYRIPNVVEHPLHFTDTRRLLYVVSYEKLASPKSTNLLAEIKPDLIIADEAHKLKNTHAVVTRRFMRYMRENPGTRFCALSASLTTRSIKDYAHLSKYALREGSPLPILYPLLEAMAAVIDPSEMPAPPGALTALCNPGEPVRAGYRRRLLETPGVVGSAGRRLPVALNLHKREIQLPAPVADALEKMRERWVTPGGEEIQDAISFSRYARQLAAGLYTRWIWPRGEALDVRQEWVEARRDWHSEVRAYLKATNRPGYDSPHLLALAASTGRWKARAWGRWAKVKDKACPNTEVVWVSDFLVEDAVAWGRQNVGIIWYAHDALGQEIAKRGGFRLYAGGPAASASLPVESGRETIVVSQRAHAEGKNLQMFSRQLITTPSSNGVTWEQLLARMHRTGQTADEVSADIYLHTEEMMSAFLAARAKARFFEQTKGQPQRILYASRTFELPLEEVLRSNYRSEAGPSAG